MKSIWLSVNEHTLPLETPLLLMHEHGIEAIQFWNAAWRYWYSGNIVDISVLQTAKYFMVALKENIQ